jgi:hypothetical protein
MLSLTVMFAVADFVESPWLVAITDTVVGLGTIAGGVYKPADEIVPTVLFPPARLFTLHATAEL